jgi:hypothetical protein
MAEPHDAALPAERRPAAPGLSPPRQSPTAPSAEEWRDLAEHATGVGAFEWDIAAGRFSSSPEVYRLHGVDLCTSPPTSRRRG